MHRAEILATNMTIEILSWKTTKQRAITVSGKSWVRSEQWKAKAEEMMRKENPRQKKVVFYQCGERQRRPCPVLNFMWNFFFFQSFNRHETNFIAENVGSPSPLALSFNLLDQTTWWILIFHFFSLSFYSCTFKCVSYPVPATVKLHATSFVFPQQIFGGSWQCFSMISFVVPCHRLSTAFTIKFNRNSSKFQSTKRAHTRKTKKKRNM